MNPRYWRKHTMLLTGIILFLLIGLPITLFALNRQTQTNTHAQATTTVAFSPSSTTSTPLKAVVGTTLPLDVIISPNQNVVSYIRLEINYDPTYFSADASSFVLDSATNLTLQESPYFTPGKLIVSVGVGSNVAGSLTTDTKIGTLMLKPVAKTPRKGTASVSFGPSSLILSVAATDSSQENVLSGSKPAYITITSIKTTGGGGKKPH